jgi:hypothetical protein
MSAVLPIAETKARASPMPHELRLERSLALEVQRVRRLFEVHASGTRLEAEIPAAALPETAERLSKYFGLTSFEMDLLLACVGCELQPGFLDFSGAAYCEACSDLRHRKSLTFDLALAALDGAHWDSTSPSRPLRFWRLLEIGASTRLTAAELRIDERILHFLLGTSCIDDRLRGFFEPVEAGASLPGSQMAVASRIASAWWQATERHHDAPFRIRLWGGDAQTRRRIATEASVRQGYSPMRLLPQGLPAGAAECEELARLLDRESLLSGVVWLPEVQSAQVHGEELHGPFALLLERMRSPVLISSEDRLRLGDEVPIFQVAKPLVEEQRMIWQQLIERHDRASEIAGHSDIAAIDGIVAQFSMEADSIEAAFLDAEELLHAKPGAPHSLTVAIWESCRLQTRTRMHGLAQRIEPVFTAADLVLPEAQREAFDMIVAQVRHRAEVLGRWGFSGTSSRGLGLAVLFAGASGTGKTITAEALANELNLDLYRIDLSQITSKYIGETEKNLGRVFDSAEKGGSILFFDEADALFGKRTEVRDSHDRYANLEVSYLLQRMEEHTGLVVLATNMKAALDQAFLRRIRFVVNFPLPDAALREELWRRAFPRRTPTDGLDPAKLARLSISGGNIQSIALNAAFLASSLSEPVRMTHVLKAARNEYRKLEKPMTDAEIRGFQ